MSDETTTQPQPQPESAAPAAADAAQPQSQTQRSKVPLIVKGQKVDPKVAETKAKLPPLGDDDVDSGEFGSALGDRGPKVDEGDDEMLAFRSELCIHLNERPDGIPAKFWNERHKYVDVGAAIKAATDLERVLTDVRAKTKVPEVYEVPAALIGMFGEEAAPEVPLVQRAASVAKDLGLTQTQFDSFVNALADEIAGDAFLQREEQEFVALQGGNEMRAQQKTDALYRWVGQTFAADGTEGDAEVKARASDRAVAMELMKTARGRRFLERFYIGKYNAWLRSPTSAVKIDSDQRRYEGMDEVRRLKESADYWSNPAKQKKAQAILSRLYPGDSSGSAERPR